jgi:quercetin dioxygenase-like cupin family protein
MSTDRTEKIVKMERRRLSVVRPESSVPSKPTERGTGASMKVLLGPDDELPHFYTRLFTLDPGGQIPAHRHDRIEHEQVVLEGEMLLVLEGETHVVKTGDAIYIPAGVAHSYRNTSRSPVRFICVIPAAIEYHTEWLQ